MKSVTRTTQLALDFDDLDADRVAPCTHVMTNPPEIAFERRIGDLAERPGACSPVSTTPVGAVPALAATLNELAGTDLEAVETWIASRCDDAGQVRAGRPCNSAAVYRREARRFVLWLRLERQRSLAEARLADCLAYRAFLADPQPRAAWCAPRGTPIGSPQWRPFEGPLCARSRGQAITVLCCMYSFLQSQLYLAGNPWTGVAKPRNGEPRMDPGRSLSREQWAAVEQELQAGPQYLRARQLAWATRFLYTTGLRLSELTAANCGDLRWLVFDAQEPAPTDGAQSGSAAGSWIINVAGKGLKLRDVPVEARLVHELGELLSIDGGANDPRSHSDRPLLLRIAARSGRSDQGAKCRMSAQSLYRQLKQLFTRAAQRMAGAGRAHEAGPLLRASTHWLRHTHGTHSIDAGVPLDVVSHTLGHADLQITSIYVAGGELRRRARESGKLTLAAGRR